MSEPTREQADRWWGRMWRDDRLNVLNEYWTGGDPMIQPNAWWRSLPDERAIAIYSQESGK